MIPETKQPAVSRALQEAFGVNEYEDIRLTTGGLSPSLVFRIVVQGKAYLLRILLRSEAIADPRVEFACMKIASEARIAPRIWYANLEDKILITDFVEAKPFPDDTALRIAPILRRLHALPDFPKMVNSNYLDVMDGFVQRFQAANLLPEGESGQLFRRYADLLQVYPRNEAELVASHNDLKPQNMIFDGQRLWLVDWESAFLNDAYVDLAEAANFFVSDEAQEESYLSAYFAEPAGEYRRARFFLMQQAVHIFFASFLLLMTARAGLPIAADSPTPDFRDFHQRLISGEIGLTTDEEKLQYGLVHLRQAQHDMQTQRFDQSLEIVGDLHASV